MTDHFAILEQERRPWLDAEALKDAFHRRSASLHPDVSVTGNAAQFAALNAAYSTLRDPAQRVRHLLELTAPASLIPSSVPPAELGDLFMALAVARRRLDDLLAQRVAATSPLSRALLAGDQSALRRELSAAFAKLEAASDAALRELRDLDSSWSEQPGEATRVLADLYHRLAYLARWLAQTREALFRLEN